MKQKTIININPTWPVLIIIFIILLSFTIDLILNMSPKYKKITFGGFEVCCKTIEKHGDKIDLNSCIDGYKYVNISSMLTIKEVNDEKECGRITVIEP